MTRTQDGPSDSASESLPLELAKPELNTRVVRALAMYFEERFGSQALQEVLAQTGLPLSYLEDEHNWVSLKYLEQLLTLTTERSGDPHFAFKAGCYTVSPKVVGVGYSILTSMSSPRFLYKKLIELSPHYNKVGRFSVVELTKNQLILSYQPISEEYMDGALGNEFRVGQFVAWPRLAGLPDATYTSEILYLDGCPSYRYTFAWKTPAMALDPAIGTAVGAGIGALLAAQYPTMPGSVLLAGLTLLGLLVGCLLLGVRRIRLLREALGQQQAGLYNYDSTLQRRLNELHNTNVQLQTTNDELQAAIHEKDEKASALRAANELLEAQKQELEQYAAEQVRLLKLQEENKKQADQIKEMHQLQEVKTKFFSHINHQLRNPLTFLLPSIEQMLDSVDESPNEPLRNHRATLVDMRSNSRLLLRLINQLLDLSAIDSRKIRFTYESTDLNSLVERAVGYVSASARRYSIQLSTHLTPNLPNSTVAVEKLDDAVMNLLTNAFKFTPEGGTVDISTGMTDGQIWIRVRDTGPGIPRERQEQLFERFTSIGTRMSRGVGSSGLGLSIVKEYIETLHHGKVAVESELGKGSCFTLWLPPGDAAMREEFAERRRVRTAEGIPFERRKDITLNKGLPDVLTNAHDLNMAEFREYAVAREKSSLPRVAGRPTVLVVDDDLGVVHVIGGVLFKNYNILTASNRLEGEALARAHMPDLIITDLNMAEESEAGFDLCYNLKQSPETADIPIILLTSNKDAGQAGPERQRQDKSDDYMYKPFSTRQLQARVELHLERISKRRELEEKSRLLELQKRELERMAKTDGLTGVYNRRHLEDAGRTLFQEALRGHTRLACIMLDIDHFKNFNTNYGHAGGDLVLKLMAQMMHEWFGNIGTVARYGGEEFAVFLPNGDLSYATTMAESFRAEVEGRVFDEKHKFRITVSMGVSSWPELDCSSHEQLLSLADDALYAAKRTRNKVVNASPSSLMAAGGPKASTA